MSKILVIRLSALGDVAMTVPIIISLAEKYSEDEFYVLTRKGWSNMFGITPHNIKFIEADLKGKHKGFCGLNRLYKEIKSVGIDSVADLHDVLRSKYIRYRLMMAGCKVAHIDKGRADKKRLTRQHNKVKKQLMTSFERYKAVFEKLGYKAEDRFISISTENDSNKIVSNFGEKRESQKWIGIAPFAKHKGKIYPLEKTEKIVEKLSETGDFRLFLFGGGDKEKEITEQWQSKYKDVISVVGKVNMKEELQLISMLDKMISMDSANMHLASLVGTQVISIWGATHIYAGFLGWKQKAEDMVEVDLECRPCSVFGNKDCFRKDYACMNNITEEQIISALINSLNR